MSEISQIRQDYSKAKLSEKRVLANPIEQFQKWLDEAIRSKCAEPTAMALSTISPESKPTSRMVLLKGVIDGDFVFYTNYNSRKGSHLLSNPYASALFFWPELERQVNIEGKVIKGPPEESDAYFKTRPWKSRIGAIISPQSQPIVSRNELKVAFIQEASRHLAGEVPRPAHWGGFHLTPYRIEFWQGRPNRLHDRILFTLNDGAWEITRLAP